MLITSSRRTPGAATIALVGLAACQTITDPPTPHLPRDPPALISGHEIITGSSDGMRTSFYPDQPNLDPTLVGGVSFGRLFRTQLPLAAEEQVYAQPLYTDQGLFVVTEANNAYLLDAETGAVQIARAFGPPWNASDIGCGDLTPTIGITGTPVIDVATATAYFFSKTYLGDTSLAPRDRAIWLAHAVDAATLAERPGFPVRIQGTAANDPGVRFDAFAEMQRPALLFLGGVVYAGFGGHCDADDYHGWIVGVAGDGTITTMFATEAGPQKNHGAGIWQSGGGLVTDGDGRIFFATGNGYSSSFRDPIAGNVPPPTLDESLVRAQLQVDGSLRAVDFFAPYDVQYLDDADLDFGSGGPLALPAVPFGTSAIPRLALMGGKEGILYLLDRDNLGGFKQGAEGGDAVVSMVTVEGSGLWSHPAVWPGDGGYAYVIPNDGPLQAFKFGARGDGAPAFHNAGRSTDGFGYTSGSPIVTSKGTQSGTALVWVTFSTGPYGQGELRAYDALPDEDGNLNLRFEDAFGTHAKFSQPGVGAGRIYVGTADGYVLGYGAPKRTPISGNPVDFATVPVNTRKTLDVTLTANVDLTVTGLGGSPAFAAGASVPALPAKLTAGQPLVVPVTFLPTAANAYAAALTVTTSAGNGAIALKGAGQAAGPQLSVSPTAISFGGIGSGGSRAATVLLSNSGRDALTFVSFGNPGQPFRVVDLPRVGQSLAAGASVTFSAEFFPTAPGTFSDTITIASDGGTVTVFLSGSSASAGHLGISPLAIDFGLVTAGDSRTATFALSNWGDSDIIISKSKPPAMGIFTAITSLSEGTVVPGNSTWIESVAFSPTSRGTFVDQWTITASDGSGAQTVSLTGTAEDPEPRTAASRRGKAQRSSIVKGRSGSPS